MKKAICILAMLLLLSSVPTLSQNLEVYGGYGYLAQNFSSGGYASLNGWSAGTEIGFATSSRFSLATSITGAYGTQKFSGGKQTLHQYSFLAGPRLSQRSGKLRLFEHAMFGGATLSGRVGDLSDSASGFALALGGGADVRLSEHFCFRPAQFDYLLTRFASRSQNSLRYSSGLTYRF